MNNKKIDTLVEDIYSLFTSDEEVNVSPDDLSKLAEEIVHSVSFALKENHKKKKTLRLSLIGQPDRKIWYNLNKEGESTEEGLKGNDYIKFLYGHILESLLVFLCKSAGHPVTDQQKELKIGGVVGHQDARVDNVLVDFKSASSFSFKKFKEGAIFTDDPFGYIAQLSAYAQANKVKEAGFVVIDKSSGEITYCPVHHMEMINAEERINHLKKMVKSPILPDRCYDDIPDGKSGNRRLAIGCVFCEHKHDCWSSANGGKGLRNFKYANSSKFLTHVERTPDVEEIYG
jgi:hypothetical protein|tara:strand:+ start:311 stop:1171 length:861 start_codon:yes stop_codon:yes gene_type:complete